MECFEELESWPVDHVAAVVVGDSAPDYFGDVDRVFELASVTKLLTAYAMLVAVEEGVFDLDDPLGPEGSTVRHLMSHASGLSFDSLELAAGVAEKRIYSSAGFEVLGQAVERESGIEFAQYCKEAVFEPLNMHSTVLWGPAGHGARSTVADLGLFAAELLSPQILSEYTLAEAFTVAFPELSGIVPGYGMQKPCPWGLGFEVKGAKRRHWTGQSMPSDTVGHFGQSGTYLWVTPRENRAMVVLTDRDFGSWAKPLWTEFNDSVWAELSQ